MLEVNTISWTFHFQYPHGDCSGLHEISVRVDNGAAKPICIKDGPVLDESGHLIRFLTLQRNRYTVGDGSIAYNDPPNNKNRKVTSPNARAAFWGNRNKNPIFWSSFIAILTVTRIVHCDVHIIKPLRGIWDLGSKPMKRLKPLPILCILLFYQSATRSMSAVTTSFGFVHGCGKRSDHRLWGSVSILCRQMRRNVSIAVASDCHGQGNKLLEKKTSKNTQHNLFLQITKREESFLSRVREAVSAYNSNSRYQRPKRKGSTFLEDRNITGRS
ncbi:LOW QUALITY PROTEIN: hypothetical protein HID58_056420 [Brassica napus]|uniref:Uncharacterized protein n=1 Tax=Brassica napus TaxID=3708 RepID=A0ABQ8APJ8_BRANA|nr:LOW QUALITY PROTEIN: hypothetical protein HID58_056420 [Brassica napus]